MALLPDQCYALIGERVWGGELIKMWASPDLVDTKNVLIKYTNPDRRDRRPPWG